MVEVEACNILEVPIIRNHPEVLTSQLGCQATQDDLSIGSSNSRTRRND